MFSVNKLTMLFLEVLNSRSNPFQLGRHDTTQIDKQMTKDTTDTSQLGQSSQYTRPDPTRPQKNLNRRRTKHEPEYQLFFFLFFSQEVYVK